MTELICGRCGKAAKEGKAKGDHCGQYHDPVKQGMFCSGKIIEWKIMYRRKAGEPVEASIFHWGMEAGVMRYNEYVPKDGDTYPKDMQSEKYPGYLYKYDDILDNRGFDVGQWNPYVITVHGQNTKVAEGDWIIPELNGVNFYPCKPDIFEKTYELVND